jgi:type III pantothenate kinase
MLLAIDCGNTQTVFGLFDTGASGATGLTAQFRVGTNRNHTGDELAVLVRGFVELESLEGIVLCSSVPQLVREYEAFAERWAGVELLVLGPGVPTGVPIRYDDPREVGADRIANAVAARERHGVPAVVVDFGTSTNFDVVSAAGEFAGGVLAPGIEISMDALFARAARLPKVPFVAPERVISQTTTAALQSGLVYGFAGQVDAIVDRIREELGAPDAVVVATGGLADLIAPHTKTISIVDPELTLQGLRLVWQRNRGS